MSIQAAVSVNSSIKRAIRPRSYGARSSSGNVLPLPAGAVGIASVWASVNGFPLGISSSPFLDDRPLLLAEGTHSGRGQIQVRLHGFLLGQSQPLVQRAV